MSNYIPHGELAARVLASPEARRLTTPNLDERIATRRIKRLVKLGLIAPEKSDKHWRGVGELAPSHFRKRVGVRAQKQFAGGDAA
ncbi:MAG TPA: hypothetical protein VHB20_14545 [Verrucomicrobiae bacterium]|nr:hypothetical protein [Verrucomicrobiae bacterium]